MYDLSDIVAVVLTREPLEGVADLLRIKQH